MSSDVASPVISQSIRVAIIAPCPPPSGGITRIVENHLAYWPRETVRSYFAPMYPPADPRPPEGARFHDLTKSSERLWRGLGAYAGVLARAPLTRPWVYRHFVRYNAALSALIRREQINAIYAHGVWPDGASAVLQGRLHGTASVLVAYGETWHTVAEHRRQWRVEPYALKGATRVISTSQHCLNGALRRGADRDRACVIYAGVDLAKFRPGLDGAAFRTRYGIPQSATVISVLGLTLRRKLDTLLDALEVGGLGPDVHCLIGGVGEDDAYVQARARAISGVDVRPLGFVPEGELPAFYAATDVLVASPRTILECMGQSMKEAMACGRAVAGARIGGVPEAIQDGENGLLFEPDDPQDLMRVLKRLCADTGLRERMGRAGRRIAEAKFGAEVAALQTLDVLQAAVEERSPLL